MCFKFSGAEFRFSVIQAPELHLDSALDLNGTEPCSAAVEAPALTEPFSGQNGCGKEGSVSKCSKSPKKGGRLGC